MRAETPKTERFKAPFRREGESLYKLNRVSLLGKTGRLAPSEARGETAKSLPACKYSAPVFQWFFIEDEVRKVRTLCPHT